MRDYKIIFQDYSTHLRDSADDTIYIGGTTGSTFMPEKISTTISIYNLGHNSLDRYHVVEKALVKVL